MERECYHHSHLYFIPPAEVLPSEVTSDSAIWSLMQSASRPSPAVTEVQYLATSLRQLPEDGEWERRDGCHLTL